MASKTLRSSKQWLTFFTVNAERSDLLQCDIDVRLSDHERQAITKSIQAFQLGESSEGLHLYRCAERYAETAADPDYLQAIKLFIREEQRHSQYLARFMSLAGISFTRKIFIDSVFRRLRQLANLECSISVLITAEIIAKVYYRALHDATGCRFLQAICEQILRDEDMHVQFQAERLALLRKKRNLILLLTTEIVQRSLFAGTLFVVWMKCRETLRAGNPDFFLFFRRSWTELNIAMSLMDPSVYKEISVAATAF